MTARDLACLALALLLGACARAPDAGTGAAAPVPVPHAQHDHQDAHADGAHDDAPHAIARIGADMAAAIGLEVAPAGPGSLRTDIDVQGVLAPVGGRHARVVARFPGPVRRVHVGVGDHVRAGQTLAVVESNISLSDYAVTSPFAGTLLAVTVRVGDIAGDAPLFELADLRTLWVDLQVFDADAVHVDAGQPVEVQRLADGATAGTTLDRILPATAAGGQGTVARAVLDNTDGAWRPGAAVRARITVADTPVALRVPLGAVQTMDGMEVVFVHEGVDAYAARPVRLGRRDARHAEVLAGLVAGEEVVVAQSYLVKADLEKAGAAHAH